MPHLSGLGPLLPTAPQPPVAIDPPSLGPSSLAPSGSLSPSGTPGASFSDIMSSAINQVESAHDSAQQSVDKFLSGDGDDLHSTILATQRADLEFQMFMQVRNKVVSAYQEVMKMQL
jgi:flagellar hook-basal body complex protein FliE